MKYHVEKKTTIKAPIDKVKGLVADFSHWNNWSPWTIAEPDVKMTMEGSAGQPGHKMTWDGEVIGSGMNELVAVDGNHFDYDLTFITPFKSKAKVAFDFSEENGETTVVWTMDSSMPFFLFFMLPTMKAWIGMDYERGLRMLKEFAEKGSIDAETKNAGVTDFEGFDYVGIQHSATISEMKEQMPKDFQKIVDEVVVNRGLSAKHWVTLYPKTSMAKGTMTYIAAVSSENLEGVDFGENTVRGSIASTPALEITHHGSYDFLGNAWSMGMMYLRAKKMKGSGIPFEYYHNSPLEVEPKDLKTSIFFPVKK